MTTQRRLQSELLIGDVRRAYPVLTARAAASIVRWGLRAITPDDGAQLTVQALVRWVAQMSDADLQDHRQIGPVTAREIRAAIPYDGAPLSGVCPLCGASRT